MVPGVNHIVDCAGVTPLTGEAIKALAIGGMLGLVAVPPERLGFFVCTLKRVRVPAVRDLDKRVCQRSVRL